MNLPVYFISDAHLAINESIAEDQKQKKLIEFFRHISSTGGSLYILGDLFDFFFEYPHVIPKMYFQIYHELFNLKKEGINLHYMLGNHDYWVQDFVSDKLFDSIYREDSIQKIKGKTFYLTHGDGILSWDKGYRILKAAIRNPLFIWAYRWIHPTIGFRLANWISKKGQHYEHSDEYNKKILKELIKFSEQHFDNNIDYVITGHYHQASEYPTSKGKLLILGDWIRYFSYGYFDGNDLTLKFWGSNT